MKNQKLIIGIVAAVVILGLGGWFFIRRGSPTTTSIDGQGTLQVKTDDSQMSISDLMNQGGNVKCTYKVSVSDSGSVDNVFYISGKKMRAESLVKDSAGQERRSITISDGEFIYTWSDQNSTGMKIVATQSGSDTESSAWQGQAQYADPNQKMDIKCDAWTVDASMFTPPANITFTDFSAPETSQCAMCDMLTGEQKTTCLTSMNCN